MVAKPSFKLIANGADVSVRLSEDLIEIVFSDKEGSESDEITLRLANIYARASFGDSLELYLGFSDELYRCGSFSVQTISNDFKANTTEIRATALNFSSKSKIKHTKSWENSDLFSIAGVIAKQNGLALKSAGANQPIKSVLQDGQNDIDFLHSLAFKLGYLLSVKDNAIILTSKDERLKQNNTALPRYSLDISELISCEIRQANKDYYDAVVFSWQDVDKGCIKSVKVGSGDKIYKAKIASPKSDNEVLRMAKAKLDELRRGGISGQCECVGANIKAGGKLSISGISEYEGASFSIKGVTHTFNMAGYFLSISFEG